MAKKSHSHLLASTAPAALVAPDILSHVTIVGSGKGGVGKSFTSALTVDLLEIAGYAARIAQMDDQDRVQNLYPGRVETIVPVALDELRNDPAAVVAAYDPVYALLERTMQDKTPLVIDIGAPHQLAFEQYLALADVDEDIAAVDHVVTWLIVATAEPEAMRAAARTYGAVGRVLPSARRVIVLNQRDGLFRFYPGSPADKIWREELEPICKDATVVHLPVIAAGSWAPFEAAGKRFLDVVAADIPTVQAWTGRSRPASKVIRGDVAGFLSRADSRLGPILYSQVCRNAD